MSLSWLEVSMSIQRFANCLWYLIAAIAQCLVHRMAQIYQCIRRASTFSHSSSTPSAVKQGVTPIFSEENSVLPSKHLLKYQDSPTAEPLQSTALESQPTTLFAVLVGINKYEDPNIPDLCGAVNDADAIERFLISEVGVLKDRIVNLRDEEATREAIVKTLRGLAQNSAIRAQDPIFIYYAGHGSECPSPTAGSAANGMIKMLLPHDFNLQGSNAVQGQGIFDITLCKIFADIAMAKSDNITVILDCCYSGSGDKKNTSDGVHTIRGVRLPHDYIIPASFLISEPCIELNASGSYKKSMSSHVLLAACEPGQPALESQGRGVFTREFLNLLEEEGIQKLTCKDVIKHLPYIHCQSPQCEGVNQGRRLFDLKANRLPRTYSVRQTPGKPNVFILEAGEEHGIVNGTEFMVYSDEALSIHLGSIVAIDTTPFTSQCFAFGGAPFTLSQSAYAIQTRIKKGQDFRLFIPPNDPYCHHLTQLLEEIQAKPTECIIRLAKHEFEEPDLVLSTRGKVVCFEVKDKICRQYGLTHMPFHEVSVTESEYLRSILLSAADFYRHLHHLGNNDSLASMVNVECFKLEATGQLTDDFDDIFAPESSGRNLNINGTIFIDVGDENEPYGYKVTNKSDVPLYVALFYFDASDLSIVDYYLPKRLSTTDKPDFSLLPKGFLTIGIDNYDDPPRTYYLREGQNVDVGFLKIYVSTSYVDYSGMVQSTPFQSIDTRGSGDFPIHEDFWDALIIPIIQQRR